MATVSIKNYSRPAPKWFRKLKRALMILLAAANGMIASIHPDNPLLVAKVQAWCTTGAIALLEALEIVLANGEEFKEPENADE